MGQKMKNKKERKQMQFFYETSVCEYRWDQRLYTRT